MSLASTSVIGTIRIQPLDCGGRPECDDSTLDLVLESFAHLRELGAETSEVRLVASTRLSRLTGCSRAESVRANVVQLLDDLQAEYDQLAERLER